MNAQFQSWDNLRLVLAIVRGGGLSGASRILGVHHATILRRLDAFEHQSGVILFQRSVQGYVPTAIGEELATLAQRIEQEVLTAYRRLAGNDLRLSGTIRCATADYIAQTVLPGVLSQFRRQHRDIEIEVCVSARFASLTKRDADIAIRPANEIPDGLVGDRVSDIGFGIYATQSYLDRNADGLAVDEMDWIAVDETLAHVSTNKWQQKYFPKAPVRLRFDSQLGKLGAVRNGLGVAFVPHFVAREHADLICLEASEQNWQLGLWLLTHPDLRPMYRVRAFLQCAQVELSALDLLSPGQIEVKGD